MRILFVITGLGHGGAEKLLFTKCAHFNEKGFPVQVVCLTRRLGLLEDFQRKGIPVICLDITNTYTAVRAIRDYRKIVDEFKPSIIHAHMLHANIFSRIAAIGSRKKYAIINTVHDTNNRKRFLLNSIYRITNGKVDLVTAISQEAYLNHISNTKIPNSKIVCMANFVNNALFKQDKRIAINYRSSLNLQEKFVWIAVGRLFPQKDYVNLLTAFKLLSSKYPQAVLLIVGNGPLDKEVNNIILANGLSNSVKMLGVRNDVAQLLNTADAFVMSSAWEGQPIALIEAAATNLPIVATDVGGNNTIVNEGINGYLVPPKNSHALFEGMEKITNMSKSELIEMGKNSRTYVEKNFSVEAFGKKWLEIYNEKEKLYN
jgi:glycosyltransferase involved in cell wall biosynthesis